jgi:hypothetical protein
MWRKYQNLAEKAEGHPENWKNLASAHGKNGFEDMGICTKVRVFETTGSNSEVFSSWIKDIAISTGTFRDHGIMYDGMIDAPSRAIDRLRKKEQAIA